MVEICSLSEAVAELVHDGDSVALEGFTHLIPFAAGHELIRQRRRDLSVNRLTPDLIYDQLIFRPIADNAARLQALQTGEIDGYDLVEPQDIPTIQGNSDLQILDRPPFNVAYVGFNMSMPPLDNAKVRLAASHAIDRRSLNQAVHQGGSTIGISMPSPPWGVWGVPEKDLGVMIGYGKPAEEKAKAKKIMAELGFTPDKPVKVEIVTRAIAVYVDMASFIINELKQIGIDASLKQIETAQWHAMATRGEYQIGANLTGIGADDPDAKRGALIDQASREFDLTPLEADFLYRQLSEATKGQRPGPA